MGVGIALWLLSSERRPSGRGGGGPARRCGAIWSGKLSRRSGDSTGVSEVEFGLEEVEVELLLGVGEVGVGWINSQVCVCLVHVPSMGGDDGSSRWWCGYMDRIGWLLVLKVGSSCGFD